MRSQIRAKHINEARNGVLVNIFADALTLQERIYNGLPKTLVMGVAILFKEYLVRQTRHHI